MHQKAGGRGWALGGPGGAPLQRIASKYVFKVQISLSTRLAQGNEHKLNVNIFQYNIQKRASKYSLILLYTGVSCHLSEILLIGHRIP